MPDIGKVFRKYKGEVLFIFLKHVGVCDSNEAWVLAIFEALRRFSRNSVGSLIAE